MDKKEALSKCIKAAEGGVHIHVEAMPNAPKTAAVGINEWRCSIRIKVAAEAKEGEANKELLRYISELLGVPAASLSLVSGHKSHNKMVFAMGVDPRAAAERLFEAIRGSGAAGR